MRKLLPVVAMAIGIVAVPAGWCASPGDVVITEIMQNPDAVSDSYGEWIEIYNTTGSAIDVDGWTIGDGESEEHTINNSGSFLLPAGGFLVLGRNEDPAMNGGCIVDYQYSGLILGNAEDRVVIREGGTTIDSVAYDDGATFPDPTGATMECVDPLADNNAGSNWQECVVSTFGDGDYGTPGAANDPWGTPAGPPVIALVSHDPAYPSSSDTVLVSAQVSDDGGVDLVCLYYRVDGGVYLMVGMSPAGGDWYEGLIPPQAHGSSVEYYLCARDDEENTSYDPSGAPVETHGYSVEDYLPLVVINEILAAPPSDANGDGIIEVYEDEFVELYNVGTSPVDISGWTLSDDDSPGSEFIFPAGTVVEGGGFVTLFGGGSPAGFTGPVFTDDGRIGNGLANSGDTVELRRMGELVDEHTYGTEASHLESIIRVPDGVGDWTRPSEEGFDWSYSPQASNGDGTTWTTGKSWGAIKSLFF